MKRQVAFSELSELRSFFTTQWGSVQSGKPHPELASWSFGIAKDVGIYGQSKALSCRKALEPPDIEASPFKDFPPTQQHLASASVVAFKAISTKYEKVGVGIILVGAKFSS